MSYSIALYNGRQYEVESVEQFSFHTNVKLVGVPTPVNSINVGFLDKPTFIAVGTSIPIVGERYKCLKIIHSHGSQVILTPWETSPVKCISLFGNGLVHHVVTQNSCYLVSIACY